MSDFAPASTDLRSTLFWDVTQRALVVTGISELPIVLHPGTSLPNYQLRCVTFWDSMRKISLIFCIMNLFA